MSRIKFSENFPLQDRLLYIAFWTFMAVIFVAAGFYFSWLASIGSWQKQKSDVELIAEILPLGDKQLAGTITPAEEEELKSLRLELDSRSRGSSSSTGANIQTGRVEIDSSLVNRSKVRLKERED